MKPQTKQVLEAATELLVEFGLKRKSRGKAIWDISEEFAGGVLMQPRAFPDGSLHLWVTGHL